ncbi:MAG: class IV adenylate cyclase [Thermoanaerobaculales bacterium]|jgi:adenylate cyclase class 2|nr:class IV adenylate cyclase [Thermoanaerobaculales bacterium]
MIESELKIPVGDLDTVRRRLAGAGADPLGPAEREVNLLFDTADRQLAEAGRVLRIRRVGDDAIATFKGPATWQGAVKQRLEIELGVASDGAAAELFGALGFTPWLRYEKDRESWTLGEVRIDLDHTPIGDFVELEGPVEGLEEAALALGLDPSRAVAESYVGLWLRHRDEHPEAGRDMVFAE